MTPLQQKFCDLVQERGEVPVLKAAAHLGLKEADLRREFAARRHLELLRAFKKDDLILLTLF